MGMVQEKLQKQLKETNQKFRDQMNDLKRKMQERHEGDLDKLKTEKQKLLASHKEQIELNDNNWDEKINKIRTSNDNESCEKTSLFQQQSNKIDSLETKLKNLNEENKNQKSNLENKSSEINS